MNDAPDSTIPVAAPRDTKSVAAILGAILLLLVLGVLIAFCVKGSGGGGAAADAVDGVRSGRIQAVYLSNDSVYFGHLGERSGDWLELRDGFYLRSTTDAKDPSKASTTEVVPVEQQAGGDGNLLINAHEVVLVQNLTADSQIAKTIDDALS
jgi:hypothetical protein